MLTHSQDGRRDEEGTDVLDLWRDQRLSRRTDLPCAR